MRVATGPGVQLLMSCPMQVRLVYQHDGLHRLGDIAARVWPGNSRSTASPTRLPNS